jgi:hypothetical protein
MAQERLPEERAQELAARGLPQRNTQPYVESLDVALDALTRVVTLPPASLFARAAFATDAEISRGAPGERELQKWEAHGADGEDMDSLESRRGGAYDQFASEARASTPCSLARSCAQRLTRARAANEKLFNVQSSFRFEDYTTPLDPEFVRTHGHSVEKMAQEITRQSSRNSQQAAERDSGETEEEQFSAVRRPNSGSGSGSGSTNWRTKPAAAPAAAPVAAPAPAPAPAADARRPISFADAAAKKPAAPSPAPATASPAPTAVSPAPVAASPAPAAASPAPAAAAPAPAAASPAPAAASPAPAAALPAPAAASPAPAAASPAPAAASPAPAAASPAPVAASPAPVAASPAPAAASPAPASTPAGAASPAAAAPAAEKPKPKLNPNAKAFVPLSAPAAPPPLPAQPPPHMFVPAVAASYYPPWEQQQYPPPPFPHYAGPMQHYGAAMAYGYPLPQAMPPQPLPPQPPPQPRSSPPR